MAGVIVRRAGDDYRLRAVLGGGEWELPRSRFLVAQLHRALPEEETQRKVTLALLWRARPQQRFPWAPIWRLRIEGPVEPLASPTPPERRSRKP